MIQEEAKHFQIKKIIIVHEMFDYIQQTKWIY